MSNSQVVAIKQAQEHGGSDFATVNTNQLREAVRLHFPVYDSRGVLLLAAGAVVTAGIIERLLRRGVTTIRVHQGDLARVCKSAGSAPARVVAALPAQQSLPPRPAPTAAGAQAGSVSSEDLLTRLGEVLKKEVDTPFVGDHEDRHTSADLPDFSDLLQPKEAPRGAVGYDRQLAEEFSAGQEQSLNHIERMFRTIHEVRRGDVESLECVSNDALIRMVRDTDLFLSVGITPGADRYPARHSTQSAMLAMAVATNMGLDKRSVVELGVGCFTHDVGMLQMRAPVFQQQGLLDPVEFLEITKHPSHTFDLMRGVDQLAGCSRLVAYQMHERCDGSGYPRRRRDSQIHPLAKIAAVADVFVALISPRSYRPAVLPYFAMEHMLRGVKQGKFDAQSVRALLHTLSLFPIGSTVELSDGRPARVLRSNGRDFMRPVVEVWPAGRLDAAPEIVDLSQHRDLSITRPLVDPADASGAK
jgi:HD-GYP domain-containing protein (c-di-GMP phosphodiesterase class II)